MTPSETPVRYDSASTRTQDGLASPCVYFSHPVVFDVVDLPELKEQVDQAPKAPGGERLSGDATSHSGKSGVVNGRRAKARKESSRIATASTMTGNPKGNLQRL